MRLDDAPGEMATLTGLDTTVAPRILLQLNWYVRVIVVEPVFASNTSALEPPPEACDPVQSFIVLEAVHGVAARFAVVHERETEPPVDGSAEELTVSATLGASKSIEAFAKLTHPIVALPHPYPPSVYEVEDAVDVAPYPEPRKLMHPSQVVESPESARAQPESCPDVEVPVEKSIFACAPGEVLEAAPAPHELTSSGLKLTHPIFGLHAYPEKSPVCVVEFGVTFTEYEDTPQSLPPVALP